MKIRMPIPCWLLLQRLRRLCALGPISALFMVVSLWTAGCGSNSRTASSHHQAGHVHAGLNEPHHHDHVAAGHSHEDHSSADHSHVAPAHANHDHLHPGFDPEAVCTCAAARQHNGWCRRCNIGFVAGQRIESAMLFSALDPHGHELDLASFTCPSCRAAIESDGFCDACGMGFSNRLTYFTRLTHGLALGQPVAPSSISCDVCRSRAGQSGWCERCQRGLVGNSAIANQAMYERTAREYATLAAAIDRAKTCELCACAMVVHRTCPKCLISYEDGTPVGGTPDRSANAGLAPDSPQK